MSGGVLADEFRTLAQEYRDAEAEFQRVNLPKTKRRRQIVYALVMNPLGKRRSYAEVAVILDISMTRVGQMMKEYREDEQQHRPDAA